MGKMVITLGENLALRPWHFKVNLDVKGHWCDRTPFPQEGKKTLGGVRNNISLIV